MRQDGKHQLQTTAACGYGSRLALRLAGTTMQLRMAATVLGRPCRSLRVLMNEQILLSLDFPDCRVVLLDWCSSNEHRLENLICYNSDGSLRWKAALPENSGHDCFVEIALDNGQLRTNTMSCFALWLDPSTGRAVKTVFTK